MCDFYPDFILQLFTYTSAGGVSVRFNRQLCVYSLQIPACSHVISRYKYVVSRRDTPRHPDMGELDYSWIINVYPGVCTDRFTQGS